MKKHIKRKKVKGLLRVKGAITRLGVGRSSITVSNDFTEYSVIEFDDNESVEKVIVDDFLRSFLTLGKVQEYTFAKSLFGRILLYSIVTDEGKLKMPIRWFTVILIRLFLLKSLYLFPILYFLEFLILILIGLQNEAYLWFIPLFLTPIIILKKPISIYIKA